MSGCQRLGGYHSYLIARLLIGLILLSFVISACGDSTPTAIVGPTEIESTPTAVAGPTEIRSTPTPITGSIQIESTSTPFARPSEIESSPAPIAVSTQISPVDGMALSYIPAGTFQMGEDADRALEQCQLLLEPFTYNTCSRNWFTNEEPVHTVTLDSFWMDQTEVTNAMYARCVAAEACTPPRETGSYTHDNYYGNEAYADYPVIYVDWNQAAAYCQWVGRELPTEAQWEYAARDGLTEALYPWGDTFDGSLANFCDGECSLGWSNPNYNDGYADTAPVGSYPANGYGLYDMAGNVWEWVTDWYGSYSSMAVDNPSGPDSGSAKLQRGGSWGDNGDGLRVSNRVRGDPVNSYSGLGFRCSHSP